MNTTPEQDEREGMPSASDMEANSLCLGRFMACRGLPELPKSPEAESGTRIHAVLADPFAQGGLNDEEFSTFNLCEKVRDAIVKIIFGDEEENETRTICERRMWHPNRLYSAQVDRVDILERKALVIDYKTGRGDTAPAADNLQIRAQVACLSYSVPELDEIYAKIVAPLQPASNAVRYGPDEIAIAKREIETLCVTITTEGQPRTPGPVQCQYCRAKNVCPERQSALMALRPIDPMKLSAIPNESFPKLLDACEMAEQAIKDYWQEAEDRDKANPGCIPGYASKPGNIKHPISDPNGVFAKCLNNGLKDVRNEATGEVITAQQIFIACVKVGKDAVKEIMKTATGKKGKELDQIMTQIYAGNTETTQDKPSLRMVK